MGSCISRLCFHGGGGCGATGIALCVQVARTRTWQPGSSHGSRKKWLISCGLLWLTPGARREHLTSQLPWATAWWLLVPCGSPAYLVVDEFSPCALWSLMIGLMVVLLKFSSHGDCGFTHGELILFQGIGMEFKAKNMLCCFREVKCKQGFATRIW